MNNLQSLRTFLLALFAIICITDLAVASSGTLVVENRSSGRTYGIMVKSDGTFESPDLPTGDYTLTCNIVGGDASDVEVSIATQPKGSENRRAGAVKYKNIVLKRGFCGPDLAKTKPGSSFCSSSIAIDEQGVHIVGSLAMKDATGKKVTIQSWNDPTRGSQNR
jgi:hypothetical protein